MKRKYFIIIIILLLTSCKNKMYTVTFVSDNNVLASVEVNKGANIKDLNTPNKDGYIFLNWLKDGEDYDTSKPIYEDITLEASWVEIPSVTKTYTISFDFGTDIKTKSVKEGDKLNEPDIYPKREKYKFIGWYKDDELYDFNSEVNEDFTLVAKFVKSRITITYDLNGGSGSTIKTEINVGSIPNKPNNPKKFGYVFTSWTINDLEYNFDAPLNDDITIKANYEAIIYVSVMFNSDGSNNIPSEIIPSGSTLSVLPIPKKEGYKFLYWSLDGLEFDINNKIDEDITLIAIYEKENT